MFAGWWWVEFGKTVYHTNNICCFFSFSLSSVPYKHSMADVCESPSPSQAPEWEYTKECVKCAKPFTMMRRVHHCRSVCVCACVCACVCVVCMQRHVVCDNHLSCPLQIFVRGCGRCFCDDDSSKRYELPPSFKQVGKQRVCDECYYLLVQLSVETNPDLHPPKPGMKRVYGWCAMKGLLLCVDCFSCV